MQTLSTDENVNHLKVFSDIIRSGKQKVSFVAPPSVQIEEKVNGKIIRELNIEQFHNFNKAKQQFLYFLNLHSTSKLNQNKELALRNQVVSGILEATLKPSIQINASMPIDMDEAQEF